jgi:hypothetical protein
LEAALQEAALPARTPVWIEAVGHERAFLWHWAQYLWPRADFLWPDDFSTFPGAPWRLRMEEKPTTLPAGGASTLRFVLAPGAPP